MSLLRGACLLLCLLWCVAAAAAPPLEAYGRLPVFQRLSLSPDGQHLAYEASIDQGRYIVVQSLGKQDEFKPIATHDHKVIALMWAGNDRLLIVLSPTVKLMLEGELGGWWQRQAVQSYDLKTGQLSSPMKWAGLHEQFISGLPIVRYVNGKPLVHVWSYYQMQRALFHVDLDKQKTTYLHKVDDDERQHLFDVNGELVVRERYQQRGQRWSIDFRRNGRWQEIQALTAEQDIPGLVNWTADGNSVLIHMTEGGQYTYKRITFADGRWAPALPDELDAEEFVNDPHRDRPIGIHNEADASDYRYFDDGLQLLWNKLGKVFPGEQIEPVAWSIDRRRSIVKVFGGKSGSAYFLIDAVANSARFIGNEYGEIGARDVAPVSVIRYAAADGLEIPAYLTLPIAREPRKLPLVVLPHGGPAARDSLGFDWWAQALASRGYAVLQPNFRGSDGYGRKFLEAGFGQWGRKMQTDLSDGVQHLAEQGIVDPARVCIVGASYGGYAALAGVTLQKGIYRCAVSVAGVADLRTFIEAGRGEARNIDENLSTRFWTRFFGFSKADDTRLAELSPLRHAAEADAPVLLIHGADDIVVLYEQTRQMSERLAYYQKPYELVKLADEDHNLARAKTRLQMLQSTVKFLEQYNPP